MTKAKTPIRQSGRETITTPAESGGRLNRTPSQTSSTAIDAANAMAAAVIALDEPGKALVSLRTPQAEQQQLAAGVVQKE